MQVTFQNVGAVSVGAIQGRLDSNTVAAAERDLLAVIDSGTSRLVLDLGQLDYISSAGLRVMLVLAKRIKPIGGRLVLCNMNPQVGEVFEISGFLSIMTIVPTREEALVAAS